MCFLSVFQKPSRGLRSHLLSSCKENTSPSHGPGNTSMSPPRGMPNGRRSSRGDREGRSTRFRISFLPRPRRTGLLFSAPSPERNREATDSIRPPTPVPRSPDLRRPSASLRSTRKSPLSVWRRPPDAVWQGSDFRKCLLRGCRAAVRSRHS